MSPEGAAMMRKLLVFAILFGALWSWPLRAQEPVPPQAVDFTLPDVDGRPLKLSHYRGRWVLVNFWATWCGPCLREIPELTWVFEKRSSRIIVIGVNFETINRRSLKNFIRKHEINYPVVRIGDEPLIPFEPLPGLPSTFFVSPQGEYVARHVGALTARDIERFIE